MTQLVCEECSTPYAPDLKKCPHCGSKGRHEEGAEPTTQPAKKAAAKAAPARDREKDES